MQFGRSWLLQLQIGSETGLKNPISEPFQLSVELQKKVDPLSGMTVNLITVDQAWAAAEHLRAQAWPEPLDFLKALSQTWQAWIIKEQAQLLRLRLETLPGRAWDMTATGTFYRQVAQVQTLESKNKSPRKIYLSFRQPWVSSEVENILADAKTLELRQLSTLIQKYSSLHRLQVFDVFEKFVEFDFQF